MSWQEKEFFRFRPRLTLVLVFAVLLCQSEAHQSQVTEIENCSHVAFASMKKHNFTEVVKDGEQFILNLLDCTKEIHKLILEASETEDCKTFDEMIPSEVLASVMNEKIPEAINTASFATKEQRLVLAVYLVHISHKIRYFSCLANVWTKSVITLQPDHKKSIERVHIELKQNILGFLDEKLIAQWKSDNITNLDNNVKTLLTMLTTFSTTLIHSLEEISSSKDGGLPSWLSWLLSFFRSERENIAKRLDELRTETVTLRDELKRLKTAISEFPAGSLLSLPTIIITISVASLACCCRLVR